MNREILGQEVCYYTDAIENFDLFMNTLRDLDSMGVADGGEVNAWKSWTSSNDSNFVYGQTKTFCLDNIRHSKNEIGTKSEYVYNSIMQTFYDVCKDYASLLGDCDEPRIFPTFNIKKYHSGMAMGSHFDQLDGDKTLRYSMVMYLNEDYEGGEISFQLRDYDGGWTSTEGWVRGAPSVDLDYEIAVRNKSIDFGVKPKANSVVVFPSSAPYFHTAHTVKSGYKFMVPGHWIHNHMDFHR